MMLPKEVKKWVIFRGGRHERPPAEKGDSYGEKLSLKRLERRGVPLRFFKPFLWDQKGGGEKLKFP